MRFVLPSLLAIAITGIATVSAQQGNTAPAAAAPAPATAQTAPAAPAAEAPAATPAAEQKTAPAAENADALRTRGEYITKHVAMCVICHSKKDENGNVIPGSEFQGGEIPLKTPYKGKAWANWAPALQPKAVEYGEEVVTLLTTGIVPRTGQPPARPMPPYAFSEEDARAIVEYLKTAQ